MKISPEWVSQNRALLNTEDSVERRLGSADNDPGYAAAARRKQRGVSSDQAVLGERLIKALRPIEPHLDDALDRRDRTDVQANSSRDP